MGERTTWRIAGLGERFGEAESDPHGLTRQFDRAFEMESPLTHTLKSLRKTIQSFPASGGVLVYLADWRLEDEIELESLIKDIQRRGHCFNVLGGEACFGRPWNDGFYPPGGARDPRGGNYDAYVGRAPFEIDTRRPYHAGDSAWPHLPFYFSGAWWTTKFPGTRQVIIKKDDYGREEVEGLQEDIRERHPEGEITWASENYSFPMPSTYGPYPLMRAAAVSGGRYVLWSWNPGGRSDVVLNFQRCDLYPASLASRSVQAKQARRDPLARGLLEAWNLVADNRVSVARTTAPFGGAGLRSREMQYAKGAGPWLRLAGEVHLA